MKTLGCDLRGRLLGMYGCIFSKESGPRMHSRYEVDGTLLLPSDALIGVQATSAAVRTVCE